MPQLDISNFNIAISVLGGWIALFGLVSYLCKETYYLSEALISFLVGVAFSPTGANWLRPLTYVGGSEVKLDAVTLAFSRLVLDVQLVIAGVQLPRQYLWKERWPLAILLGPVMTAMWLTTGLLVWVLVPGINEGGRMPFVQALAIGACVTPTDPILSNVLIKGRFADKHVPRALQDLIVAESGANDGLGYPFLYLALYLVQAGVGQSLPGAGAASGSDVRRAVGLFFGEMLGYTILLSVAYGAAAGFLAKVLLRWAKDRAFVDRESFLVFAIAMGLFVGGTCGLVGTDDVLACFIAGNAFSWDDWFRVETEDDALQPTVDMLLNVAVFLWLGAVCPWSLLFTGYDDSSPVVPVGRLVALGVLVLLLRRLPWVLAARRWVPHLAAADIWQSVFTGFFGPMGVSAVFYLYVALAFLDRMAGSASDGDHTTLNGLRARLTVVVWFLCMCSVVVHGMSIPLGKAGVYLPRKLGRALSSKPAEVATPLPLDGPLSSG